jgi:hypothetical protein
MRLVNPPRARIDRATRRSFFAAACKCMTHESAQQGSGHTGAGRRRGGGRRSDEGPPRADDERRRTRQVRGRSWCGRHALGTVSRNIGSPWPCWGGSEGGARRMPTKGKGESIVVRATATLRGPGAARGTTASPSAGRLRSESAAAAAAAHIAHILSSGRLVAWPWVVSLSVGGGRR